jgi:hypothetical protein
MTIGGPPASVNHALDGSEANRLRGIPAGEIPRVRRDSKGVRGKGGTGFPDPPFKAVLGTFLSKPRADSTV